MTSPTDLVRRLAVAGAVTVGAELAVALLWPAPEQPEFDPSGRFGPPAEAPLRIGALGDSTLTAPGVDDPDQIWVRVVARRLAECLGRPVELRSWGVGGATAATVLASQMESAILFRPDLTLVSVGANDALRGIPMHRFERHLNTVVGGLTEAGSLVITSGVGDLGSIPRLAPPLRQMVSQIGRRADRVHERVAEGHGAVKADQWSWAAAEFRGRADVWSADHFHPNDKGHAIWAETCWESLEPLLTRLEGVERP